MLTSVCREPSLGFTGGPVERSLKVWAKICAKFKSCVWEFGQLSGVLWPERERELWAFGPQLSWKWQFVPLHLWGTREMCV